MILDSLTCGTLVFGCLVATSFLILSQTNSTVLLYLSGDTQYSAVMDHDGIRRMSFAL